MNVNTRQLRGFLLIAQLGSFTQAAERLHITQSGLSAMMRDLEQQLDCRLFDRTTRSVSLTEEGERLVPVAQQVIEELEGVGASIKKATLTRQRILTIAVSPVFAALIAPAARKAFQHKYPDAELRIREVPRMQVQGMVESGAVDAGFGIASKAPTGIQLGSIIDLDLLHIRAASEADKRMRSARKLKPMRWHDLPAGRLVLLTPDIPVQEVTNALLSSLGRFGGDCEFAGSMQTALGMVGEGFGATILPALVLPMCGRQRFSVHRLMDPERAMPFQVMTKAGREPAPLLTHFSKLLQEVMDGLCCDQPAG
jgi:DNA-binding transcriptional LysR family regulator